MPSNCYVDNAFHLASDSWNFIAVGVYNKFQNSYGTPYLNREYANIYKNNDYFILDVEIWNNAIYMETLTDTIYIGDPSNINFNTNFFKLKQFKIAAGSEIFSEAMALNFCNTPGILIESDPHCSLYLNTSISLRQHTEI